MRHKNIRRLHHNQQLASLNEKRRQFQWKQQQKQQQKSQKPKFFEKNNKKYEKLIQKPPSTNREPPQQVFHKEKQPLSPGRPQVNIYFWPTSLVITMSFLGNSALDCSLYRWRLFVYFTFPSV